MAKAKKPKMRYSTSELSLIKSTFHANEPILQALRKVFFQVELSDEDKTALKPVTESAEVRALLRKTYYPEIEIDAPVGQLVDLWLTVDSQELSPAEARTALRVRNRLMELIHAGLDRLEDKKLKMTLAQPIPDWKPDFEMDDETLNADFVARNSLITHTEFQIQQLSFLAEKVEETPEQAQARLERNSTK